VSTTQRLEDVTPDDYDYIFDTNVKGASSWRKRWASACWRAPRARRRAPTSAGASSTSPRHAALKVMPQIGVYCMSKAAVVQMTKAMALEWGRFGINVNALCPGYITPTLNEEHWSTEGGQKLVSMLPRKRVGKPEDLDGLIVLLASGQSHFVNGAVIAADDGFAL
jgi:NAD(P)-dependent dehydrogenase (short-subunit alcohol dehydrogenase family)